MKNIKINDLEKLQQSNQIVSSDKRAVDILLSAINDWPTSIYNLNDFENEINLFIKGEATKEKIGEALSLIDYSKHAWHAESLTQVLAQPRASMKGRPSV